MTPAQPGLPRRIGRAAWLGLRGLFDFCLLAWRRRFLRGERLRRYQQRQARRLVRYAVEHSPFYRDLYSGRSLDDLAGLPTVDKQIMMDRFSDFNTAGLDKEELIEFALAMEHSRDFLHYFRERYVVGLSSGTSGSKGLVLTERSLAERLPAVFLARSGVPLRLLPFRIVFILRVHNQAFANIDSPLITLRYLHSMTPVERIVDEINGLRANLLLAPPSVLRLIGAQADRIREPLKLLMCYAEVLGDDDDAAIRQAFGAPLIQLYQASEGLIGSSCSAGRLHVNEDLVLLEALDEHGQPAPPGTPCHKLLVTNLYNRLQPLIRYQLNDLLVLGQGCPCGSGFRVIERVLGRSDDLFWLERSDGSGHQYLFPDITARYVMNACELVREYQVEQTAYDRVVVRLVTLPGRFAEAAPLVEQSLRRLLDEYGCRQPAIEVVEQPPQLNPHSQKLRRIARSFAHPDSPK
ncbi:MAG: hypothetical protein JXR83_18815 [Deltaproteobacteria bacterium]|nr:hypothetical protein [Deltaproteobacteria bacterium]